MDLSTAIAVVVLVGLLIGLVAYFYKHSAVKLERDLLAEEKSRLARQVLAAEEARKKLNEAALRRWQEAAETAKDGTAESLKAAIERAKGKKK